MVRNLMILISFSLGQKKKERISHLIKKKPFRCWFNTSVTALISLMQAMMMEPAGTSGTTTFLENFHRWFHMSGKECPADGMRQFFKEFRPNDNIQDRMSKMW